MTYLFGLKWHDQLRQPIRPIDEATARQRWDTAQVSVSKVSEQGAVPEYTLVHQPGDTYLGVTFYNEHGSQTINYDFRPQPDRPDELFLEGVSVRVYPDGQDRYLDLRSSTAHTTLLFRPNGYARSRFVVTGEPEARIDEFTGVDVSTHWIPRPVYGDWDRLGRRREPDLPDLDAIP